MFLIIDIGNTYQKVAVFDGQDQMIVKNQYTHLSIQDLYPVFDQYVIDAAIISSVGEDFASVMNWLSKKTKTLTFNQNLKLPIVIDRDRLKTLGTDRVANAVGANAMFPNEDVLSIQAGTCLVTDMVSAKNRYMGGTISLGLRMRFNAIHHFTARLPLVEPQSVDFIMGNNTRDDILSGVIHGFKAEIEDIITHYKREYSDIKIIVTGGDASFVNGLIKNSIFAAPNVVLFGLYKILRLNVSEK